MRSPSEVKAERRRLQGRVRLSKSVLSDLATALIEFHKLSPEDQEWVRQQVELRDADQAFMLEPPEKK